MKINKLSQRLQKNRPMKMVSLRIPEDVVEDLKRIAPLLGFTGYQALIKAYTDKACEQIWNDLKAMLRFRPSLRVCENKASKMRSSHLPYQKPEAWPIFLKVLAVANTAPRVLKAIPSPSTSTELRAGFAHW